LPARKKEGPTRCGRPRRPSGGEKSGTASGRPQVMKNAGTHLPDVVLKPTAVRCTRPRFSPGLRPTLLPTRCKALGVPAAIGMRVNLKHRSKLFARLDLRSGSTSEGMIGPFSRQSRSVICSASGCRKGKSQGYSDELNACYLRREKAKPQADGVLASASLRLCPRFLNR